ncbi:MAG: GNAT family N-acetyltransferase [Chloroflexota bacterium]|nr:GNAT family N-acetyltransferase [Chloroflexota bacterium]
MREPVTLREVSDPKDPAIAAFGEMQTAAYFAPETLIPPRYIPQLLDAAGQTGTRRNFLVVAEQDQRVVGGTLFHWLADAGSGFSSFLGVDRSLRRQGIARRLHETRLSILDRVASPRPPGVFIDVVSPTRLPPDELAREQEIGSDPWHRRRAFARLGFFQVDVRYEQPFGGPNGGPVTILDLLYCPREPADSVPTALVVATMRAYWSPWFGAERASRHAHELELRSHGRSELRLIPPDAG